MRFLFATMVLIFPGCGARSAAIPPATAHIQLVSIPEVRPVQAPIVPPAPPALQTETTVEQVAMLYSQIEQKLVGAVSSDGVTAEYIKDVQTADTAARRKLAVIEDPNSHPTLESVEAARDAVGHLGDVLAKPPDQVQP